VQLRLIFRALVQIATAFFLIVALFVGYVWFATNNAQSKAEAACNAAPIGTSQEKVMATIGSIDADPRLGSSSSEFISVGFRGAIMDRWFCNIQLSEGMVVNHEVRLLD